MKNNKLGKKVKDLRKRKGLSQEQLSYNSGLSLRTIQRIENNESSPTGESLKRIIKSLNSSPDELLDWAETEDNGYLKAMNLSTLTFLVFPLLGILVPLIMWFSKKDKLKNINQLGLNILNFEITWNIVLFLGLILSSLMITNEMDSTGEVILLVNSVSSIQRGTLIFIMMMYILNIFLIVFNIFRIEKDKSLFYRPRINFIR